MKILKSHEFLVPGLLFYKKGKPTLYRVLRLNNKILKVRSVEFNSWDSHIEYTIPNKQAFFEGETIVVVENELDLNEFHYQVSKIVQANISEKYRYYKIFRDQQKANLYKFKNLLNFSGLTI